MSFEKRLRPQPNRNFKPWKVIQMWPHLDEIQGVFFEMKTIFFDADIAAKYGVDEAIIIANFAYWIEKNEANGRNFYDGRYWTYNSIDAFTKLFPFWTARQIRRILKSLEDQNVIITGNYNPSTYDRTTWYAFADGFDKNVNLHLTETSNGKDQNVQPIPDIIPEENNQCSLSSNENKEPRARKTSEPLCLFANSRYADFDTFAKEFTNPEFENIDIAYYYESVKDWSASGGKKKHDWIATARNFMRGDNRKGCLHVKTDAGLSDDAVKYLKMMDDAE